MSLNSFSDILVVIDFSTSTEFAVKQAIELANNSGATIHLLHVVKPKTKTRLAELFSGFSGTTKLSVVEVTNKLEEWKHAIEETVLESQVKTYLAKGAVRSNIIYTANRIKPDLIIISDKNRTGLFRRFQRLCSNEISMITGCPVLNIINGARNRKMQNIVVPVRNFVPKRKIEMLHVFAKIYRAKIHLLAVKNNSTGEINGANILQDTYQLLKSELPNSIEYHLVNSDNFPKAVLKYAEKIGADMLFVNPEAETKLSMLTGKQINEALGPSSKLKILFVRPILDK